MQTIFRRDGNDYKFPLSVEKLVPREFYLKKDIPNKLLKFLPDPIKVQCSINNKQYQFVYLWDKLEVDNIRNLPICKKFL